MDDLVSTEWLDAQRGAPDLVLLDATFHALEPERDAAAEFAAGHIPGARHLDLKTLCDPDDPLPSMLPPAELFADRMRALGIGPESGVVLYDAAAHHTAARAWWVMRHFGLRRIALLDGGFAKWRAEGRPIETGTSAPAPAAPPLALSDDPATLRTKQQMVANLTTRRETVIDARSPTRFTGEEGDPRAGVAPGHIPGSYNVRYSALFAADGTWLREAALRNAFRAAGVDLARPLVMTCGSGTTAAVLAFGAHLLGRDDVALYDGSWSEWGADPDTPKATGPA
ncbi:MAG: sulfurtransferase [Sphingomonadaceae bacterium]|nr:sulfurtransferase [Sphingomonadaceae bacterium]